jgi:hypothetical protein
LSGLTPSTATTGAVTLAGTLGVASGGTGLTAGTSGGILGYTATGTLASSVALTANALVLGAGAGATPTPMASLGTTTTVLHGNASGAPTFGAVSLTADVTGVLPTANGGTNLGGATPFTSGGVVYASSTSALATGSALTFNGSTALTVPQEVYRNSSNSYLRIDGGSGSGTGPNLTLYGESHSSVPGAFYLTAKGTGNAIYTVDATGAHIWNVNAEAMRLTSTGLGIGTSSIVYGASGRGVLNLGGSGGGLLGFQVGGVAKGYVAHFDSSMQMWNEAASPILFATNALERMRLDSAGNLGLGVTPSAWLSTAKAIQYGTTGSVYSTGGDTYFNNNWYLDSSSSSIYLTTNAAQSYAQTGGKHLWYTAASGTAGTAVSFTQAMTLDADGDLGIGSTNPTQKLHVQSATNAQGLFKTTGAGGGSNRSSVILEGPSNTWYINTNGSDLNGSDGALGFYGNSVTRMVIDTSGNLGLGVTPSASTTPQFQIGRLTLQDVSNYSTIGNNATYNGGYKYIAAVAASVYQQNAGAHYFYTSTSSPVIGNDPVFSQAMTLDASGNFGVGTTSPLTRVESRGTPNADWGSALLFDNRTVAINQGGVLAFGGYKTTTTSQSTFAQIAGRKENATSANEAGYLAFITNDNTAYVERARIDSSGNLLVGTTSVVLDGKITCSFAGNAINGATFNDTGNGSGAGFIIFSESGTAIGNISRVGTTSAVAYNTTSDQRLKSNITNSESVIDKLMQVKVRQYDWTQGAVHQDYGFIAQELEPVLSGIVTKGKTDEDMWQLDYAKLTPHLVKAMQEQQAIIESLKARLDAANL